MTRPVFVTIIQVAVWLSFLLEAQSTCRMLFFFFNDTATPEISTLSLHDALPIWAGLPARCNKDKNSFAVGPIKQLSDIRDRKSTRLNSQSPMYLVCRLLREKKRFPHRRELRRQRGCQVTPACCARCWA